ncbi:MAG: DoxX family protein [Gammaproteobacteria bacterium]|nr:DoxX family protein [Gammaproteobacteria bacterium]
MSPITRFLKLPRRFVERFKLDCLGPLTLRLFLVPIFWLAGTEKLAHIESTIEWFGNADWGLGLPWPAVFAYCASILEVIAAVMLLVGLGVRWITIPLIVIMIASIIAVHHENAWLAMPGHGAEASTHLHQFFNWLHQNMPGQQDFLSTLGEPVILNSGVPFAIVYLVMLISLFFSGAGRILSLDYWLVKKF